jgi:DNA-binding MarR family transcriptional regulator
MARERVSSLQRRIPAWLQAHQQRTRGTMSASATELGQALAHDKGNLSHSVANLEAKGLVTIARTPEGQVEAVDLTAQGRQVAVQRTGSRD